MGSTTGLGIVYADADSMKVEPSYMHDRYSGMRSTNSSPAEEESAEEASDDGGEA
jgi:ribosomal protein S24E